MADEEAQESEEKKGGNKLVLIIIIVVVVLLVLVGGGIGLFFALSGGGDDAEEDPELAAEEELEELPFGELSGAVLPLEPFIVNLKVKGNFLKASLQLQFIDPELPPTIENDIPKVRDAIIAILSSRSAKEILTEEGKNDLKDEIVERVNDALGLEDIEGVYFTEFIVQ